MKKQSEIDTSLQGKRHVNTFAAYHAMGAILVQ